MSSIRQQLLHTLYIDIQEVEAMVEESTKELRSQLEVQETINKKKTMEIESMKEGTCKLIASILP